MLKRQVSQDLADATGKRVVVLITDGEETCGGDPAAVIETLTESGVDVRVSIVGFAIDDEDLKSQFRYWASLGGGNYHDASNADDLAHSVRQLFVAQLADPAPSVSHPAAEAEPARRSFSASTIGEWERRRTPPARSPGCACGSPRVAQPTGYTSTAAPKLQQQPSIDCGHTSPDVGAGGCWSHRYSLETHT